MLKLYFLHKKVRAQSRYGIIFIIHTKRSTNLKKGTVEHIYRPITLMLNRQNEETHVVFIEQIILFLNQRYNLWWSWPLQEWTKN